MTVHKIDIWMPLYVGDYMKDTADLTRAEHGSYLLSMMTYWTNGESLPDNRFRAICGKEFERIKDFYSFVDGRWHHKRIDEELAKCRERMKKAKERSMKGVLAKQAKATNV